MSHDRGRRPGAGPFTLFRRGLLVLGACALSAGCAKHEDPAEPAADPVVPVHLAAVESRVFEDQVDATGTWRSQGETVVAAPFPCVVLELSVRAGDVVRAGQPLGAVTTLESHAALRGATLLSQEAHDPESRSEAEHALQLARRDRVHVPIDAPQAGVVVRRSIEPGAQVAEAAEILAIVPWSSMVFEAHVPQERRGRLRPGERAVIREQGLPPRAATVQRVLPAADVADQSTLAWLTPATLAPAPQIDHFGSASITLGASHRAPAIPDSAVVEDDLTGVKRVAVVDSTGHAHWRAVTLGAGAAGWHELQPPNLAPGTAVVVEGQRGLPDGSRVKKSP